MRKVVGLINLFFGIIESFIGISYIFFTIPKLLKMYKNLNVDLPYSAKTAYLYPALLILIGIVNLLIGLGNFNLLFRDKSELVYKIGMFLVIFSFIVTGAITSIMLNSVLGPIYSLTTVSPT